MSLQRIGLLDAFKWRHSVRTYAGVPFTAEAKAIVAKTMEKVAAWETPFGTKSKLHQTDDALTTFGMVKNANGNLIVCVPRDRKEEDAAKTVVDCGVLGQVAVMELARHKIGTVWLAGSLKRSQCDTYVPGYKTIGLIPYGLGEIQNGTMARLTKWMAQSKSRKPLHDIAYDLEKKRPYTTENAGELLPMLSALRSGPSAINAQPWRFVVDGQNIHMFNAKGNLVSMFDIGIAIANTQMLALDMNHKPKISFKENVPAPLGGKYVCSCSFRD